MGISIQTNYASLVAKNTLQGTNNDLSKSLERLSTGFRINSSSDDAAGLQIATRLTAQINGSTVASRNSLDAISMLQTAEGGLEGLTNIAFRMKDLATQSANGVMTSNDRDALQSEFLSLAQEMTSIVDNTSFGGRTILKGPESFASIPVQYQIGATSSETLTVDTTNELQGLDDDIFLFDSNGEVIIWNNDVDRLQNQISIDTIAERENFAQGSTSSSFLPDGVGIAPLRGAYSSYSNLNTLANNSPLLPTAPTPPDDTDVSKYPLGASDPAYVSDKSVYDTNKAQYDTDKAQYDIDKPIYDDAVSDLSDVNAKVIQSVDHKITYNTSGDYDTDPSYGPSRSDSDTRTEIINLAHKPIIHVADQAYAQQAMTYMDDMINNISSYRATYGASINRLNHTISNLGNMTENLSASRGRIMDADFAIESASMAKSQMLMQSGASMLGATKMVSQLAMSMLS